MGEAAKTYMTARAGERQEDRPRTDALAPDEAKALARVQAEAEAAGATLATGGKGGLPPSLVLGVMRRDRYRCKRCGGSEGLSLHHKGGIVASKWLSHKGHSMAFDNLATLCVKCHDAIHGEARAEGIDASQVTPEGDEGTRRDKGLPPAEA
jgi:hypothetical protein